METLMRLAGGRRVFSKATAMMAGSSRQAIEAAGLSASDVDHWIPHQANSRIIGAVQKKLGLADDKVLSSVALFANSSAATIPLTLSLAAETRPFEAGDTLLMSAAGAGMTGGSVVWGL
jgi:3-oxoacyl-[acyl-carrier-protein] synthase-3